jgi:ring-1,2-phenylacetyl-CoA epoxidase subunit PaaD
VTPTAPDVRAIAGAVPDPEIPVISIADLGILRGVDIGDDGTIVVTITPTYSGCSALDAIRCDIRTTLAAHGFEKVEVKTALRPAWSTDWITEQGRERLRRFGIAPPRPRGEPQLLQLAVACPRCGSTSTRLVSQFGSTACKSHRVCNDCAEPFDHFKEL